MEPNGRSLALKGGAVPAGEKFAGESLAPTVGLTHTRLDICELESASFPVGTGNVPASPVDDGWTPSQYWMVFVDGAWELEGLYVSEHSCDDAV